MLGTLFFASRFSAACRDQQKNTIILQKSNHFYRSFRSCFASPCKVRGFSIKGAATASLKVTKRVCRMHLSAPSGLLGNYASVYLNRVIFLLFTQSGIFLGPTAAVLPCL